MITYHYLLRWVHAYSTDAYADIARVILVYNVKDSFRNRISRLTAKDCCDFIACDCDIRIIQVIFRR